MSRNVRSAGLVALREAARGATVVWDFDGVLADTEPFHQASYAAVCRELGFEPTGDWYAPLVGHTEEHNWNRLLDAGLGTGGTSRTPTVGDLARRRARSFRASAAASLRPSWIASRVLPALAGVAARQVVVSNGDLRLIDDVVVDWDLARHVTVARRSVGDDKRGLVADHLTGSGPTVLVEDTDRYLELGRELGAFTVGVRHTHNGHARLAADLVLSLRS